MWSTGICLYMRVRLKTAQDLTSLAHLSFLNLSQWSSFSASLCPHIPPSIQYISRTTKLSLLRLGTPHDFGKTYFKHRKVFSWDWGPSQHLHVWICHLERIFWQSHSWISGLCCLSKTSKKCHPMFKCHSYQLPSVLIISIYLISMTRFRGSMIMNLV